MEPRLIAWFICVVFSVVSLVKLMRGRQTKLMLALRGYVEARLEWSRKKAKAARLAQKMAREKAAEEAKQAQMSAPHASEPVAAKYNNKQKAA